MKTLQGTAFQCMECANRGVTTRFICGKRGLSALRERVAEHFQETGHCAFKPMNPKPGTFYVIAGTTERIGPVYKEGIDEESWTKEVIDEARSNQLNVEPSWELSNDSSED